MVKAEAVKMDLDEAIEVCEGAADARRQTKAETRRLMDAWRDLQAAVGTIPMRRQALIEALARAGETFDESGMDEAKAGLGDLVVEREQLRIRAEGLLKEVEAETGRAAEPDAGLDEAIRILGAWIEERRNLLATAAGTRQLLRTYLHQRVEIAAAIRAWLAAGSKPSGT